MKRLFHRAIAAVLMLSAGGAAAATPARAHQASTTQQRQDLALPASKRLSPAQRAFVNAAGWETRGALPPWVNRHGYALRQLRRPVRTGRC